MEWSSSMMKLHHKYFITAFTISLFVVYTGLAQGAGDIKSCYAGIDYIKPVNTQAERALYVFIDQTTPLSGKMRKKISALLTTWGKKGDLLKVARFSANYRGKYPELIFNQKIDGLPEHEYVYNLRWKDKKEFLACIENQEKEIKLQFVKLIRQTLEANNPKTPKTELLYSLKELSRQVIIKHEAKSKTVLLVSDGMENSEVLSFYKTGGLKKVNVRKTILKIRRQGLIGHWKGTNVYIYGLALGSKKKPYTSPKSVNRLKSFWEHYFVEGGAVVKGIGAPELLVSSIE